MRRVQRSATNAVKELRKVQSEMDKRGGRKSGGGRSQSETQLQRDLAAAAKKEIALQNKLDAERARNHEKEMKRQQREQAARKRQISSIIETTNAGSAANAKRVRELKALDVALKKGDITQEEFIRSAARLSKQNIGLTKTTNTYTAAATKATIATGRLAGSMQTLSAAAAFAQGPLGGVAARAASLGTLSRISMGPLTKGLLGVGAALGSVAVAWGYATKTPSPSTRRWTRCPRSRVWWAKTWHS